MRHPANFKNAAQQSRAFSHAQQAHGFAIGDLRASYPPAIVADLVHHMRPRCMALDLYSAGFPIATILEGIVDEIGEDLLHREQVAHNGWKVVDGDGCSLFGGAMRDGLCDRRHDGVHVDLFGLEVAAALT